MSDPAGVMIVEDFATALAALRERSGLSYRAMETAAQKLPRDTRGRGWTLPRSTAESMVKTGRVPRRETLQVFLTVCGVSQADWSQWIAAWQRTRSTDLARPPGAIRVADADPRWLGVHAAIEVPGVSDRELPAYIERDVDHAEHGVRARLRAACVRGGFVLLVGGSSTGKTRCAVEAVRAEVPGWWLIHPGGGGQVAALAAAPPARTVLWLDEIQRYLEGEHGLTGGVVRDLLHAGLVVVGTVWPKWYADYTVLPVTPDDPDPYAREREVLGLAAIIHIDVEFSSAEQTRARNVAERDRRIQVALDNPGYGLTQTLAAAPELVRHWETAQAAAPYAWAVMTAAIDAARLGVRSPLSADLLRAAAVDYCTPRQQAMAAGSWFEDALAYATRQLHGAAAALDPVGTGMGQITGYTVADYLLDHASRVRHSARVPASTWNAFLAAYLYAVDDINRVADGARSRLLYGYAIPLFGFAADSGDEEAAMRLVDLLAQCGDADGLRVRADAGDERAAFRLADLLAERGDSDGLRVRADSGDEQANYMLADLLAERGDADGLRVRADAGDRFAADRLPTVLAKCGDVDEAVRLLRVRAEAGDTWAAGMVPYLLARRGDADQRRVRADDDEDAARRLSGSADTFMQSLREAAGTGNERAVDLLATVLLAERGDVDGLRSRVDAGDWWAAERLPDLLAKCGRAKDADRLKRFGLNPDGSIASAPTW